jgi:uncharacterized protein
MVFRRRERRPLWRALLEAAWPRGGWARAISYIQHRLRRLPDSPEKIARGMAAGAFVSFTPFYGLHFVVAVVLAWLVRGNVLASIIGTFVNNFLTLVPIAALCLALGHWILGTDRPGGPGGPPGEPRGGPGHGRLEELGTVFWDAGWDLWHNLLAVFTPREAEWAGLREFWREIFLPYLVGGILPGLLVAGASYLVTVSLVAAYQANRRKALAERMARLRGPQAR